MKLIISMLLILSFTFSACSWCEVEVPVYLEATCPAIKTISIVPPIEVIVGPEGNISNKSIPSLLKGSKQLRKSESYYYEQITKYNKEFTVDKLDE